MHFEIVFFINEDTKYDVTHICGQLISVAILAQDDLHFNS